MADSARASTTSSMKKGGSGINGSDLSKENIIKPTFDTLMEEDSKVLEAYRTDVDEFFCSHYKVMWQGLILKDVAPIIIHKVKVTPEV
jgi:hypothetical protein